MNVECQTIRVPTGVQDYRPALYGGIAAIELGVDGIRRVALDVDPRELEQRIVLAYTGAPRNSGTNNWEITKRHIDGDRAHLRLLRADPRHGRRRCATALERGDWDEVGRQIAHRVGQPQAAGAGRHDADDRRSDRARDGGRRDGRQGLRRRRRRLPVLLRPARPRARRSPRRSPPAARALLDYRIETEGLRLG